MGNNIGYNDHVLHQLWLPLHQRHSASRHRSLKDSTDIMRSAFRVPWALQMTPSPRWLARKDRWEECLGVLALVHGKVDRNRPFVAREYEDIKEYCEFERLNADIAYMELLKPNMINRIHIGVFTQIWS